MIVLSLFHRAMEGNKGMKGRNNKGPWQEANLHFKLRRCYFYNPPAIHSIGDNCCIVNSFDGGGTLSFTVNSGLLENTASAWDTNEWCRCPVNHTCFVTLSRWTAADFKCASYRNTRLHWLSLNIFRVTVVICESFLTTVAIQLPQSTGMFGNPTENTNIYQTWMLEYLTMMPFICCDSVEFTQDDSLAPCEPGFILAAALDLVLVVRRKCLLVKQIKGD